MIACSRNTCWRIVVVAWLGALSSCAVVPPEVSQSPTALREFQAREARLGARSQWQAGGRVAVRAEAESFSARLDWRQNGDRYRIVLSNFLGQGLLKLEGEPGQVELWTADQPPRHASDPEVLLREEAGWSMPLAGLRFWVLGVRRPDSNAELLELDGEGRPLKIVQDGWTVEYDGYQEAVGGAEGAEGSEGEDMPRKLTLTSPDVEARLAISRWKL